MQKNYEGYREHMMKGRAARENRETRNKVNFTHALEMLAKVDTVEIPFVLDDNYELTDPKTSQKLLETLEALVAHLKSDEFKAAVANRRDPTTFRLPKNSPLHDPRDVDVE